MVVSNGSSADHDVEKNMNENERATDQDIVSVPEVPIVVEEDVDDQVDEHESPIPPMANRDGNLARMVTPGPYSIFSPRQKTLIIFMVTIAATFSGLSGNIYFPSIPTISRNLGVSNEAVTLTVTAYMIFQGLSPSIWGAIADVKGRRITYICTFIVYIGACIGLAETKHYYQLVILRCLQSTGSASTIAIGAGVLGDVTTREERGGYMGIYQAGLLAPVAIGPILGGVFSGSLGWRAIFWFLTIYAGVFLIFLICFLPETLRYLVGNGSKPPRGLAKSPLSYYQRRRLKDDPNIDHDAASITTTRSSKPHVNIFTTILILFNKEVTFIILFLSIYYTVWQMIIASMSSLFQSVYNLSEIELGLCYISNGVGCVMGTFLTGKFLDWDYRRLKARYISNPDAFPLEHARLRSVWPYAAIECISVLVFGWTVDRHVHISAPIIFVFFLGWSSTSLQAVINTLLVDIFPKQGASATATLNLARCLMGAGGTAAVLPIADAIGIGWTFTLFTGVLVCSLGLLVVQLRWGPRWRRRREEKGRI